MGTGNKTYGISRASGVFISLAAILFAAALMLPVAIKLVPSAMDEVMGVLIASLIIPVVALFRPLQEFSVLPDGLGFSTVFSKQIYKVLWSDVTDVRLKRDVFGIMNMEFGQRNKRLYKKVPLRIIPERREFLEQLLISFPPDHPKRILLESIVRSYLK